MMVCRWLSSCFLSCWCAPLLVVMSFVVRCGAWLMNSLECNELLLVYYCGFYDCGVCFVILINNVCEW